MYITRAKEEDIKKIVDIHVSCWKEVYKFIPENVHKVRTRKFRFNQWKKVLRIKKLETGLFVLKTDLNVVVGFCYCAPNIDKDLEAASELHAAYILPEFRGGITGPLMMVTMVEFLLKQDLHPIGLWAFDQNKIQRWYRLIGFQRTVRRDRIIENVAIPESGFVCPDPYRLLDRMYRKLNENASSSFQSPEYYPSSQHLHLAAQRKLGVREKSEKGHRVP